jgi:ketosteroid isomerase-like protein
VTRICNSGFAEWREREADCDRRVQCRPTSRSFRAHTTPTRFVAEDDTVVATGTHSWKHRATGKPAEVQLAHVWTFRDGKVISMQQHVDTLKVQESGLSSLGSSVGAVSC